MQLGSKRVDVTLYEGPIVVEVNRSRIIRIDIQLLNPSEEMTNTQPVFWI